MRLYFNQNAPLARIECNTFTEARVAAQLQMLEKNAASARWSFVNERMSFSLPLIIIIKYLRLFSASTLVIFNSVLFRLECVTLKESAFSAVYAMHCWRSLFFLSHSARQCVLKKNTLLESEWTVFK
jgi:hypothetical protein